MTNNIFLIPLLSFYGDVIFFFPNDYIIFFSYYQSRPKLKMTWLGTLRKRGPESANHVTVARRTVLRFQQNASNVNRTPYICKFPASLQKAG